LRVIDPGMLASVQDLGRRGVGWMGVSPCGAADWLSARAANRLVGNRDDCALIETTFSGATFELGCGATIAVTGAQAPLAVGHRVVEVGRTHGARAGDRIVIGAARRGLRSYLAVAGGVIVPALFGSASTDVTSGFGGRVLARGDEMALGEGATGAAKRASYSSPIQSSPSPSPSHGSVLRVLPGLDERLAAHLFDTTFTVGSRSSRQALMLDGGRAVIGGATGVVSFGVIAGCVQISSDGTPMVLMVEHQTTGGYAVAACVIYADLPVAAQLRPGEPVRFELVGSEQAEQALAERMRALDAISESLERSASPLASAEERLAQGFFEGAES
jgi:biotin-dependent carboxylase-like uncharacterized protein